MGKIAAIILTKNEEKHIRDAISNVKKYVDEVVVIDSGSTDATCSIARELGAKVAVRPWDNDFAAQRNFGLEQTEADWVIYIDADERLLEETGKKLRNIVDGNEQIQGKFRRTNIAFGYTFRYGAFGPDYVTRLFPRNAVKWVNKVHERPECKLPLEVMTGSLQHYTYASWQQWWEKAGHYTTIWAEDKHSQGKTTSIGDVLLHTFGGMFKVYIIQKGILDGAMGITSTLQHGVYTLSKYMKLLELQRKG